MSLFPQITPFKQLSADELAKAKEVMYNFNLLRTWANALASPVGGFGADAHGDLSASTSTMHSAASVKCAADVGGNINLATHVADAAIHGGGGGGTGELIGYKDDRTEYVVSGATACSVIVPAGTTGVGVAMSVSCSFILSGSASYHGGELTLMINGVERVSPYPIYGPMFNSTGSTALRISTEVIYDVGMGWDNTSDVTLGWWINLSGGAYISIPTMLVRTL